MKSYVYVENARSPEYRKKLQLIHDLGINPFAKEYLADPRFGPKEIIDETIHWFVFANQHGYENMAHQFVFVSQEYAESLLDLSPEAQIDLFILIKKICDEYHISGGGIITRFGAGLKSGATVKHLHVQLIEPKEGKAVPAWFGSEKK